MTALELCPGRFALAVLHSRINVEASGRLGCLLSGIEGIRPKLCGVFAVLPHARVSFESLLGGRPFIGFTSLADLALADSGGSHDETAALGAPRFLSRDPTERSVTCTEGTNALVGSNPAANRPEPRRALGGCARRGRLPDLWGRHPSERIRAVLNRALRGGRSGS